MKISVITVCFNAEATLEATLRSVASQRHRQVEHLVIDGGSTDGTLGILGRYREQIAGSITEPDEGLYDAMNKGIAMATGDVIGFLNADDVYSGPDTLCAVARALASEDVHACYADLVFLDGDRPVRRYSSRRFRPSRLAYGWMPAHPTFYARRSLYEEWGGFKMGYQIAADYELVCRFFVKAKITAAYVPEVWVKMQTGGVSTRGWRSNLLLNQEIVRACRENGISTNLFKVLLKYPAKLTELVRFRL